MDTNVVIVLVAVAALAVAGVVVARASRPPADLRALIETQGARLDRLADGLTRQATDEESLRDGLERTRELVGDLRARAEERRRAEDEAWTAIHRLRTVLDGGGARGRAGENLVHHALEHLPPSMVERDFRVNGKVVEFALVLPDGRRLPVDSKWTAVRELEELAAADDGAGEALCREVERTVVARAREVAAYLDPSLTTPFAVAAVPDAAYEVCRKAHADAFARGVVLVPYTTALPVLLALYALAGRFGGAGDAEACLAELEGLVGAMEHTLENKVVKPTATLRNAADEWRDHLGKARGALARGRGLAAGDPDPPALRQVGG